MTSTNISIRKDAYEFLKRFKTRDKSFSDVILGFKKDKNEILNFFGVLKSVDWKEREKEMRNLRGSFARRLK